jgi:uncharacterized membrane protein YedE/YeeE
MIFENFTPVASTMGGVLIGLSATLTLLLHGRIAGISGIISGAIDPNSESGQREWRLVFIAGLLLGAAPLFLLMPEKFVLGVERSPVAVVLAGILVGVGTRMGSGCTSGHGVCGISRGSLRSILATVIFIATGILTVLLSNQFFGEQL